MRHLWWQATLVTSCYSPNVPVDGQGDADSSSGTATSSETVSTATTATTAAATAADPSTESETVGDSSSGSVCGDAVIEGLEACDDGTQNGSYGFCLEDCSAVGARCGDGETQEREEGCDDANKEDGDGCNSDCTLSGSLLWETRSPTGAQLGGCGGLAVTPELGVVASMNGNPSSALKFDSQGKQVWTRATSLLVIPGDVTVSPNGEVSMIGGNGPTVLVSRWSSDGDALWSRESENVDGNGYADFAYGIASDDQGRVLSVGGRSQSFANVFHDVFLRRYSDDGVLMWTRIIGDNSIDDFARSAVYSPQDFYVACGGANLLGMRKPWVVAMSLDNSVLWTYFGDGETIEDEFRDVAVDGDGGIVLAGLVTTNDELSISITRLSPDGAEEWSRIVDNFDGVNEQGLGVAIDSAGRVLVAAETEGGWLAKYSGDGETLIWTFVVEDALDGFADVEVDADDNVFVCGGRPNQVDRGLDDLWIAKLTP